MLVSTTGLTASSASPSDTRVDLTQLVASLDRWWPAVFGVFTLLVGGVAATLALAKPFWNDEIYTILIAGLPSLNNIWQATKDGMDLMPPLNATLTHAIHSLAGTGRVTTRLPALIGFWTVTLVAFDIVRRRSHVVAALSAALLPCLSEAFRYATEARGYALMLGLFAAALWSWSEAARGHRRVVHLSVLFITLAAGLWTQYFAILAFVPIGIGELLRVQRTRKVDYGIAGAAAFALIAALPLRALLPAAALRAATFWSRASFGQIGPTYAFLFAPLLSKSVLMALCIVSVLALIGRIAGNRPSASGPYYDLPVYEIAAGLATVAVPAGAILLGVLGVGAFVPRYGLAGVIGVSVVLPLAVARMPSRQGFGDLVLCTALLATFSTSVYRNVIDERVAYRDPVAARPALMTQLERGDTIAVSGTTEYLQLWYYLPAQFRDRLVYLIDPAASLRELGTDTLDRDYLAVRRWSKVPAIDYDTFVGAHPTFLVYDFGDGWLTRNLQKRGASLRPIGKDADAVLFVASSLPASTIAAGSPDVSH